MGYWCFPLTYFFRPWSTRKLKYFGIWKFRDWKFFLMVKVMTSALWISDCDKFETKAGGTLHLDRHLTDGQFRDCIWVIKKPGGYEHIHINIIRLRLKFGKKTCTSLFKKIKIAIKPVKLWKNMIISSQMLPDRSVPSGKNPLLSKWSVTSSLF